MNKKMSVSDKLGVNRYKSDDENSHIVICNGCFSPAEMRKLVRACPAGLYSVDDEGKLCVSYLGCLECGTCRVLGIDKTLKSWDYPESGFGVSFRQG